MMLKFFKSKKDKQEESVDDGCYDYMDPVTLHGKGVVFWYNDYFCYILGYLITEDITDTSCFQGQL